MKSCTISKWDEKELGEAGYVHLWGYIWEEGRVGKMGRVWIGFDVWVEFVREYLCFLVR